MISHTNPSMELLPIIDEQDEVIGSCAKEEAHAKGLLHRLAAVMLQNEKGEYLIPTGSEIKVDAGKLYHSAAGHVQIGETYIQAAVRELEEETGVKIKGGNMHYLGAYWLDVEHSLSHKEKALVKVFLAKYRSGMGDIVLNEEQIQEQWLAKEELKALYIQGNERFSAPFRLTCERLLQIGS